MDKVKKTFWQYVCDNASVSDWGYFAFTVAVVIEAIFLLVLAITARNN